MITAETLAWGAFAFYVIIDIAKFIILHIIKFVFMMIDKHIERSKSKEE